MGEFSLARAIRAISRDGHDTSGRLWASAPVEKEWFEKAQGDQVTGADGAWLAPEYWAQTFVPNVRSFSVIDSLPTIRMIIPRRLAYIPATAADVTVSYPSENMAVTPTQFEASAVVYSARKAMVTINVSNELLDDASDLAERWLRLEAGKAIAVDRDSRIFNGYMGADSMAGMVDSPYTYSVPSTVSGSLATGAVTNTYTPSLYHLAQLKAKVETVNGVDVGPISGQAQANGAVCHALFDQTIHTQPSTNPTSPAPWVDSTGRPFWPGDLNEGQGLLGMKWCKTNVLPAPSGTAPGGMVIIGDWRFFVVYETLSYDFEATDMAAYGSDQTVVRIKYRWDAHPTQPAAFAVLNGCDL